MKVRFVKSARAAICSLFLLGAASSEAVPVTVKELNVDPAAKVNIKVDGFYQGWAYAGVVNLLVDGTPMDAFCIDPFHFSKKIEMTYNSIPLMEGPKPPGGAMGTEKAELISKLWTLAYSPTMLPAQAAALQLAIWEVIAGDKFTLLSSYDFGAAELLSDAQAYDGPVTSLIALTGPGQDYVVASVPEGGATLVLLGIGIVCLARLKKHCTA